MDGLAGLLDGPRARGAFLLRILLDRPGRCASRTRRRCRSPRSSAGTCGSARTARSRSGSRPATSWSGSAPTTGRSPTTPRRPTQIVIHPGQVCTTVDGHVVVEEMSQGVRSWGNSAVGRDGAADRRLRGRGRGDPPPAPGPPAHPGAARRRARHPAHRPARPGGRPRRSRPGGRARPAARPAADQPAPHLVRPTRRRAARLVRRAGRPGRRPGPAPDAAPPRAPVDGRRAGRDGGRLARGVRPEVHRLVGEPPMAFLTDWRLSLAADLLLEPDATIGSVARQVGYARRSPSAPRSSASGG